LKTKYLILSLILFVSCSHKKQENLSESIFVSQNYTNLSSVNKELFLDSIANKSNEFQKTVSSANFLLDLSTEYFYLNKAKKSLNICEQTLSLSKKLKDTILIAKSYDYIGDTFNQSYRDSAYIFYQEAEKLYKLLGNDELEANMLFKKAYILYYEGNYIESEIKLSQALQLIKSSKDFELLYMTYNLMGCTLDKLGDYDIALKYFDNAENELVHLSKKGVSSNLIFNYGVTLSINKANVFDKRGQYKKSIKLLGSILAESKNYKNPKDYIILIGNLGYSKMKSGDLKEAEKLLAKALDLTYKSGNEADAINKLINLGELKLIKKDTCKSHFFISKALVLCKKLKASNELKLVYGLLSTVEPERNSYYKDKIIQLTDSLTVIQRKSRNKYARIEYETAVVEDANKELSSKNLYLIFGVLVLVGALGIRYVVGQRKEIAYRKKLQKAELEFFELMQSSQIALNEAKKEEQNRISRELHDNVMNRLYGTRLQLGMLNSITNIEAEEKRLEQINSLQVIEHDIRAISHDLHTDALACHFDFAVLLAQCVQQASSTTKTSLHFESTPEINWESISGLVKITIYRIVQEGLSNVVKYAAATECMATITKPNVNSLLLIISDNGNGFDLAQTSTGIGLKNMSERARLVNADFRIQSSIGQGTTIECQFVV
jgi:signal transduction histidine kinase/Tfp pilus assembly protein PilF